MTNTANNFCSACGNSLIESAVVCPSCGSATSKFQNANLTGQTVRKSKTTAVVLAVFLGPWSWLYTFKRDQAKFWIWLGGFVLINGYYLTLDVWERSYYGQSTVPLLWTLGFSIAAIITQASRSQNFFTEFPNLRK